MKSIPVRGRLAAARLLVALLSLPAAGALLAQSAPPATPHPPVQAAVAKPGAKPAAKPVAKPVAQATAAAAAPAAPVELTDAQREAAGRAYVGSAECEFNQKVKLDPVDGQPGHFHLQHGKQRYLMQVQETSTGAVRLEDKRSGMVWLQIPAKSMLMNAKAGQRVADNCRHAQQLAALPGAPGGALGVVPAAPVQAAAPTAAPVAAPIAVPVAVPTAATVPSAAASQ